MAWAFGASGAIAEGVTSGTVDVAFPADITAGQLIALAFYCRAGGDDLQVPTGWTDIRSQGPEQQGVFGIIAAGTETGNLTVDFDGATGGRFMAQMARFTGAPATIDEHTGAVRAASLADLPTPAATISVDNTLVLSTGGKQNNVSPYTPPSGFIEIGDANNAAADTSFVFGYQIQTTATNIVEDIWDSAAGNTNSAKSIVTSLVAGVEAGGLLLRRRYAQLRA